jgi:hypothetical protein
MQRSGAVLAQLESGGRCYVAQDFDEGAAVIRLLKNATDIKRLGSRVFVVICSEDTLQAALRLY